MRAGFLFNHYLGYQVLHGAPFAFALSQLQQEIEVELLFSTREALQQAQTIAEFYPGQKCKFLLLNQSVFSALIPDYFPSLHRPLSLWTNRTLLASYDALIAPEKNYIVLKALPAFKKTRFIGLRHGAGDRPVSFNKGRLKFDYLLVPGQSYYERFKDQLPEDCCAIAGYPKFEALMKMQPQSLRLFDNERPVVLYTPHFHNKQSSWLAFGSQILDFFANNNQYNLVFAPHIRLFKHRRYHGNIKLDAYQDKDNIIIDTGSERSFDMTYTRAADIYLGDVSSQVYEFVHQKRRPCIFLNPNRLDAATMNFWQLGAVIDDINALAAKLASAEADLAGRYIDKQDYLLKRAFADDVEAASTRGARAIQRFMQV